MGQCNAAKGLAVARQSATNPRTEYDFARPGLGDSVTCTVGVFLVADHGGVPSDRGIGRVTVTPEGATPGQDLAPLDIAQLFKADNSTEYFAGLLTSREGRISAGDHWPFRVAGPARAQVKT